MELTADKKSKLCLCCAKIFTPVNLRSGYCSDTCRTTHKATKNKLYYQNNKQAFVERSRNRRAQGLDKKDIIVERKSAIKRKYQLEWDAFVKLCEAAKYKCQICAVPLKLATTKHDEDESASVDHCHSTNKVRGILCRKCNAALGLFKENKSNLKKAIAYLELYGPLG